MLLQPGDEIFNSKYRLLSPIGDGGMACVWLVEEVTFGRRRVAFKELKPFSTKGRLVDDPTTG